MHIYFSHMYIMFKLHQGEFSDLIVRGVAEDSIKSKNLLLQII